MSLTCPIHTTTELKFDAPAAYKDNAKKGGYSVGYCKLCGEYHTVKNPE